MSPLRGRAGSIEGSPLWLSPFNPHDGMADRSLRVLLIDDDDITGHLIRQLLQHTRRKFEIHWAVSPSARPLMSGGDFDVCLVCTREARPLADDVLELLRFAQSLATTTPIIAVTGPNVVEDIAIRLMSEGASDSLFKDELTSRLLERSIRYAIERNRITYALRNSEERVRRVLNTAPVLLFELDREGIVTFVDGTALRVLRLRAEDLIGRSAFEVYPAMANETRRALAGRAFTVTVDINGAILHAHIAPIFGPAGAIAGAAGVATDITRRVRNERLLKASRRELQGERDFITTVLNTMGSLAVVLDRDGRIVRFNLACETLTGYSFAEVAGTQFWELFVRPEDIPTIRRGFDLMVRGRPSTRYENICLTRTGERRLISWSNNTIVNASGSVEYIVATGIDITARKAAEEALLESQHLFRTFMDHSSSVTFIKDENLRYLFVNRRFVDLLGREQGAVVGRTDAELFAANAMVAWEDADREVLATGLDVSRFDSVAGDRHFLTNKFAIRDAAGRTLIGGQAIEITERVHAELSLRKSEERFQLAAKATNDAIWDLDLATDTLWWNSNVHQLFRYDPGSVDVTLEWWRARLHPEDRAGVLDSLDAALEKNDQFWMCEYRFLCGDGRYAYVLDRGYVMRDAEGAPCRMIGAMTDFTTRREAEEALRASEERYRRIVETAHEGIVMIDNDGVTTFANARVTELLGYTGDELCGRRFDSLTDRRGHAAAARLWQVEAAAQARQSDLPLIRKDGSVVWVILSAGPLRDQGGRHVGTLVMVSDITARKEAEAALREANDQLEMRVAQRTTELVDMMARLERSHQLQQRFVADASHDLRTPLTVVRAELDLLLERAEHEPGIRASLLRIANESKRLENMASDLLLLATIDAQRSIAIADSIQLDDLLFDCVTQLRTLSAEKRIAWNIDVAEPLVLRCNASMLRRALTNILENAIKYSEDSTVVDVRLFNSDRDAIVEVVDRGLGIHADDLPHVFERFFRGDLTRNTTGTGLGLSIVKAVIDGHGGEIDVASTPGHGTSIRLTLPLQGVPEEVG